MTYSGNSPNSQSGIDKLRNTVDLASLGTVATGFGLKGLDATKTNPNIRGFSAASKQVVSELGNIGKQSVKTFSELSTNIKNSESVLESFSRKTLSAEQRLGKLASGLNEATKKTNFPNLDGIAKGTDNIGKSFSGGKLGAKITNQGFDTSNFNTPKVAPPINSFLENSNNQLSTSATQSISKPSFPVNRLDDSSIDVITGQSSKLQSQADETAKLVSEVTKVKKLSNDITFSSLNSGAAKVETKLGKIGTKLVEISNVLDKAQWFTFALSSADILISKIGEVKSAFQNVEGSLDVAKLSGVDTRQTERITSQIGTEGGAAATIAGGFAGSQDIVGIAKEATAEYNRFSQAVAKVDTVFSGSQGIKSFTRDIQELVGSELQNAVTSTEALSGAYEVLSSGFTGAGESLNVLSAGLKLSVSSGTESGQVLRLLGKTLNAYGKDASEAAEVAGLLNRTVENGITTIPELSNGFGAAAGTAKEAGVAIEGLAAAVGTLTSAGETTPRAFTQIKSFAREVTSGDLQSRVDEENITNKDGSRLDVSKEAIEKTSLQEVVVDLKANTTDDQLSRILSGTAYDLVINLSSEGGDKALETLSSIKDTSDQISDSLSDALEQNLEKVFKVKLETDEILQFEQITNRVSESLIKIGQAVAPAFESGVDKLEKLANTVNLVSEKFPGLIKASVDTALAFKAIGTSTKAIASGAAQITGLFIATRFLTGAAFGQIGALADLNKGWRRYNVVASKVVGQNGRLYNSFEKLGLVLSQITGLGAADSINFSSGGNKVQQLRGLPSTTKATGSVLKRDNVVTASALSSAISPSQVGEISNVTPVAQVQGRTNPLTRFNNTVRTRNVPFGGIGRGIKQTAGLTGSSFISGINATTSAFGISQNIGGGLASNTSTAKLASGFSKIGKGISSAVGAVGSFVKALAPATLALGALASAVAVLDSIILRLNEPKRQAEKQNKFLDKLEDSAVDEKSKKTIENLDRGRFAKDKNIDPLESKDKESRFQPFSVGQGFNDAVRGSALAFRNYRANIKGNQDISSGEFERRQKQDTKILEQQNQNYIETLTNEKKLNNTLNSGENIKGRQTFVENEKEKLETRNNFITAFEGRKNKLEEELKNTSSTSTKAETLTSEINRLKTALSELERGVDKTAKAIIAQEQAINVGETLKNRYEDGNQQENRSFSNRNRTFETRKEDINELFTEVTTPSKRGETEDALTKLDKKTKEQINSILKQSKSGQITTEDAIGKLDNLKNQTGANGKTLGETVSTEVELLFSEIGIEAIKGKVEKLKKDLESERTTLQFQVDSGLINKAEFQSQVADSRQENIKEQLNVNRRQQELAQDRPAELGKLQNTEQELISKQQAVNLQNKNAPLNIQQQFLETQQQSKLTETNLNDQNIRAKQLQKLENRKSQQESLEERLIESDAPQKQIDSLNRSIQTTDIQIAQKRFENQNAVSTNRQQQLQKQSVSPIINEASVQPELRQLEIQKAQSLVSNKENLIADLQQNPDTPKEQITGLQNSLVRDRNRVERLQREDSFAKEKVSAQNEIEKINSEQKGLDLQQRGLEATSSTASSGLNALGKLSSIISGLDVDDNTKKELQQEALDKQLELSNKKFEIEKKILGLEEKKLALAQKQAELEAKTKVSEADANLAEAKANKEQVFANPNATDKQKEAAEARVEAAENRVDTAQENVAITKEQGNVDTAINKGKQAGVDVKQTNEELGIKARKASLTETNRDDYEVFEEAGKAIANTSKTVASNLDILNKAITKTSANLGISPVVGNNNNEKTRTTLRSYQGEGADFVRRNSEKTSEVESEQVKSARKSQQQSRDFESNRMIKEIDDLRSRVNEFTSSPVKRNTDNNSETQQKQAPSLNLDFSMPVTIQGNADDETIDNLKSEFESLITSKFNEVAEQLNNSF